MKRAAFTSREVVATAPQGEGNLAVAGHCQHVGKPSLACPAVLLAAAVAAALPE